MIKKKETLLSILINHVEPGSEVYSDKASSYVTVRGRSHLEEYGFNHYYVNHSLEFVDSLDPSIHTNNIERSWRSLRASISHIKRSIPEDQVIAYLDAFQFLTMFQRESLYNVFLQIVKTLTVIY